MNVDPRALLSISRSLWDSLLGLDVHPLDDAACPAEDRETVRSWIEVSGPWRGAIMLECHESVARHAAAMLLSADGQEATVDEIQDALRELADSMGKRVQDLLPESSTLAPASVVNGEELLAMKELGGLRLSCEGRPVRIALFESRQEAVAQE